MGASRSATLLLALLTSTLAHAAATDVVLKDLSLDRPLVLDEDVNYTLKNVTVTGLSDAAAITLAGRIKSVTMDNCTFGRVWTGPEGRAAGLECAGAFIAKFIAKNTTFFDAEIQLATLKDGSFGRVTFSRCRFSTSDAFLKQSQSQNPWRTAAPVTEFYNIDRLELLDNEYVNTTVVIHPSVKQVIIRGQIPGLQLQSNATQLIFLSPGQLADAVPHPNAPVAAKKG